MPQYKIAQIEHQGRILNLTLMSASFINLPAKEKQEITVKVQECAKSTGLKGRIIPVWDIGRGRINYFGPPYLHEYLSSINLTFVKRNINNELNCD